MTKGVAALFIGGPLDEERRWLPDAFPDYLVPFRDTTRTASISEASDLANYTVLTYRRIRRYRSLRGQDCAIYEFLL